LSVSRHVLLIKPDGTLWSWGKQLFGEFGHGKTGLQEQENPKQVGGDNDWVSVEAAENISFGIKKDGSLWAWGRNYDAFPKRIYPDQKWKSIVAHEDLLVATTTEGEIYTSNHYSSNDISPIIGGPRNSKWIDLTAGYRHFLGITAKEDLWAWGKGGMSNHCGQMGLGNKTPPAIDLSPIRVGKDSNWASVSAKGNHSLAIKKDGTIWAWGHNHSGQVGNGSRSFDGVLKPVQIGRENNWKFIAAGQSFSTAIKTDGTIWGWGNQIFTEPTKLSSESDWIDIRAGTGHTFALKRDQTLWHFDASSPRGMTEPPVKVLDLTSPANASAPPKDTNPTENPSTKVSLSAATKDQPFTNSLGMKFVPIPGTSLFFSIYETRTSEYKKFIVESGKGFNLGYKNETANADYPARASRNGGSGKDANTEFFCAWLTERDRKLGKLSKDWEYRLPSIEEWKTAAALDSVEVNNQTTSDDKNLKAVGSGKPNKFGLYDVAGNAWELTLDNASKSLTKMAALVGGSPRPLAGGYTNGAEGFRCIIAKVKAEKPTPDTESKKPETTTAQTFENTLGMKFVFVKEAGVYFSIWETRVKDFKAYTNAKNIDPKKWEPVIYPQTAVHPVVNTNWEDSVAFCEWLTKKELAEGKLKPRQAYRLPTDSEWSVAVGLTDKLDSTINKRKTEIAGVYPWGKQWPPPKGAGNYHEELKVDSFNDRTAPVGSFKVNKYGIYDLGGNVSEWCQDLMELSDQKWHIKRGATYDNHDPKVLASSARFPWRRMFAEPQRIGGVIFDRSRSVSVGFRCVITKHGSHGETK
jgi:formylglycine-generating enzyme required for sulfatase activity